jgi:4-amino-4-deoxy-L-arabinose transferase-like glycosyltransferase
VSRRSRILALVIAAGFALRLVYSLSVPETRFLVFDGRDYRDIAWNLAAGHGFSISFYRWFEPVPPEVRAKTAREERTPTGSIMAGTTETGPRGTAPVEAEPPGIDGRHPDLYRPPLLPLLGAALSFLPGPWLLYARFMSALLGALAILLVFGVARHLFGDRSALLAATVMAVYPYAIVYSGRWSTENLALVTLWGGLLVWLSRPFGVRRSLLASGVLLAAAGLTRPNLLPLALVVLVISWWRLGLRPALLAALGIALALSPWMARNAIRTGVPNPTTFFGPYNMWLGMNDAAFRMYENPSSPEFRAQKSRLYEELSREKVGELEARGIFDVHRIDRFWWDEFLKYVREHPRRAAAILGHRALHFFRPWISPAMVSSGFFWISVLAQLPLLVLAIVSLAIDRRAREPLLLWMVAVCFLFSLPFVFQHRLRFPVYDPLLVILGAHGAFLLTSRYLGRRRAALVRAAAGGRGIHEPDAGRF